MNEKKRFRYSDAREPHPPKIITANSHSKISYTYILTYTFIHTHTHTPCNRTILYRDFLNDT